MTARRVHDCMHRASTVPCFCTSDMQTRMFGRWDVSLAGWARVRICMNVQLFVNMYSTLASTNIHFLLCATLGTLYAMYLSVRLCCCHAMLLSCCHAAVNECSGCGNCPKKGDLLMFMNLNWTRSVCITQLYLAETYFDHSRDTELI